MGSRLLRLALNSKSKKCKHDHVLIDNRDITNSKDIADAFNSFFSSIGSTISENVPPSPNNYTDYLTENYPANFCMVPTHDNELIDVAKHLKSSHSTGADNLSMRIIKTTMHEVATPLSFIFNQSFLTGIIPVAMKTAKIVPIHKSGSKKLQNNYRPISILPHFPKF